MRPAQRPTRVGQLWLLLHLGKVAECIRLEQATTMMLQQMGTRLEASTTRWWWRRIQPLDPHRTRTSETMTDTADRRQQMRLQSPFLATAVPKGPIRTTQLRALRSRSVG